MPMTSETKYLKCFANSLQPESSRTLENGECRLSSIPKQSRHDSRCGKTIAYFPVIAFLALDGSNLAKQSAVTVAQNMYLI